MKAVNKIAKGLLWFWHLLKGWLPQALGVVGSALALIWGTFGEDGWSRGAVWFGLAIGFLLAAIVTQFALQRPSYMALSGQIAHLNARLAARSRGIEDALTALLRHLANHCGLASNDDRVSIYYLHNGNFVLLARWSSNPNLNVPGRGSYRKDQGTIGQAWDKGFAVAKLPADPKSWKHSLVKRFGFTEAEVDSLTMHSTSIAGIRIDRDYAGVGMLVFESRQRDNVRSEHLTVIQESRIYAALADLVGAFGAHTSVVEAASRPSSARKAAEPWIPSPTT